MEEEGHIGDDDVVDVGEEFISWMISKLSGSEGVEASDSSEHSTFLSKFFIDECTNWLECDQPGSLYEVHLLE